MKKRYMVFGVSVLLALSLAVPAFGGPTNPVASISASAKATANKALKKAKAAQKTANAAQSAANAAQSTATSANSAASKAQTTANTANTAAGKAQTTADAAKTAAAAAQTTADSAKTAAAAAQATADGKMSDARFVQGTAVSGTGGNATAAANCVTGENPTGGGFVINGSQNNQVTVNLNSQYLNSWIVTAEDINGQVGESWELAAVAICAKNP